MAKIRNKKIDIKTEPKDVQNFYKILTEELDIFIEEVMKCNTSYILNDYIKELAVGMDTTVTKLSDFLYRYTNDYRDKVIILNKVISKEYYRKIRENALTKLRKNKDLKNSVLFVKENWE